MYKKILHDWPTGNSEVFSQGSGEHTLYLGKMERFSNSLFYTCSNVLFSPKFVNDNSNLTQG